MHVRKERDAVALLEDIAQAGGSFRGRVLARTLHRCGGAGCFRVGGRLLCVVPTGSGGRKLWLPVCLHLARSREEEDAVSSRRRGCTEGGGGRVPWLWTGRSGRSGEGCSQGTWALRLAAWGGNTSGSVSDRLGNLRAHIARGAQDLCYAGMGVGRRATAQCLLKRGTAHTVPQSRLACCWRPWTQEFPSWGGNTCGSVSDRIGNPWVHRWDWRCVKFKFIQFKRELVAGPSASAT